MVRRNPHVSNCKLRKKIAAATGGQHYIETVWGRGYVLRDSEADNVPVTEEVEPAQAAVA